MTPTQSALPFETMLRAQLSEGGSIDSSALTTRAFAHDASHYLNVPACVIKPATFQDVQATLGVAHATGTPVTFRSGGTSLSGQASTSSVLVDTRTHFKDIFVDEKGGVVTLGVGVTVRRANAALTRFGRKLGPDPASEIACTIGGVIANNSSGMCCGTHENSYQTIKSLKAVLPNGYLFDSGDANADSQLASAMPELHAGLSALRARVIENPESVATIQRLFAMKNTMGYSLNAFLDFETPADILAHLFVGSEGTLGWVGEVTFKTVPQPTHNATGLLIFSSLHSASSALPALVESGAAAIELMDSVSLRVAQRDSDALPAIRELDVTDHAALLVEYQCNTPETLAEVTTLAQGRITELGVVSELPLSSDPQTRAKLWKLRKGLYTAVAGARPSGTTALLEDIAVPVGALAETCVQLNALFEKYGYVDCVIFGHAKDGNIHFMMTDDFSTPEALDRFERFTQEMVTLVLAQGGTLKAEHGTGRVMAPFMERQYGRELTEVMWEIKRLLDPNGILNPGVLLTSEPNAHMQNFKPTHAVEEEVDRCVECGYCEPVCPSKDLTLTPRQRIVLRRELAAARAAGDTRLEQELSSRYVYDGVQTCAVDGMCQTACPVLINTGDLVRRLRAHTPTPVSDRMWETAATHWKVTSKMIGSALSVAKYLPTALPKSATSLMRTLASPEQVPQWSPDLPGGGPARSTSKFLGANGTQPSEAHPDIAGATVVFLPSCQNTMYGPASGATSSQSAFEELCAKAGISVTVPTNIDSLCCGTPWSSKGFTRGKTTMQSIVTKALMGIGERLIIVCDASSCTEGFAKSLQDLDATRVQAIDGVAFVARYLLPVLKDSWEIHKVPSLSVHPTCSSTHLGSTPDLLEISQACAETVHVPDDWGCCGFAGDRGMLHPELTASATAREAREVRSVNSTRHASTNRACEVGMSRATESSYVSVLDILNDSLVARPRNA